MRRSPFPLRFLALLVAAPLLLGACDSPEEKVADYVADGEARLDAGDVERASILFRNALRIEPDNAAALLNMGRIFEQREETRRAFTAYREAAAADPSLIEAHSGYAVLALAGGRLEPVREAAGAIRERAPEHPDGLALAAALALRDDALDEAEGLAREALAAEPGHVNATSALAGVLGARGDTAGAVAAIDARFAKQGVAVPLALLKCQLLAASGDDDAVVTAFHEAIAAAPDDAGLRLALAGFHRERGDAGRAETVLRAAIGRLADSRAAAMALVRLVADTHGVDAALADIDDLSARIDDPDRTLAFVAADLLVAAGRLDEAEGRLAAVVEASDENAATALDARAGLAALARRRGDAEEARSLLDGVLEADPEHRTASFEVARIALADGDGAGAVAAARTALSEDPRWAPGLRLLADAYIARGEPDLAIRALTRLVRSAPADVASAAKLAEMLTRQGEDDRALAVWDHVIERSAQPADALVRTAEIAIRRRDWGRANRDIERLLADPQAELAGTLLTGSLRLARGDTEGGRAWFTRAREMNPDVAAPLMGLVRAHLAEDDVEGALAVVAEEVERRPDNPLAHVLTARLERRRGRPEAAVAAYERAMAARPDWATPYRETAALHERTGDVDAAVAVLEAGAAAGASPAELRLSQAFVHQRAGRMRRAIAFYAQLLDDDVETDVVINNYAALVADFARDDDAALERALNLAERFATSDEPSYVDTLGWLHFRLGDTARAIPLLRRAVAMAPDDPQLRYHLAAALDAAEEAERALAELDRAVVADASYPGLDEARRLKATLEARREAVAAE